MKNLFTIIAVAILLLIVTIGCKKDKNVTNVTLDKTEITLAVGKTATLTARVYPEDATNKTVSWTSSNSAVADIFGGVITAKEVGTTTITVITEDGNYTATCIVTVAPEWIEISGVKWARCNVDMPGTFTAKPEDAGMYYQWGRSVGWSSTDPLISSNGETIWDDSRPPGEIWEKANNPCPLGWRVPTMSELQGLIDAGIQWTTLNDVNGCIFGSGNNTIFMPAAGRREYEMGFLLDVGVVGRYWSNSAENLYGKLIGFTSEYFICGGFGPEWVRANAYPLRCVAE